MRAQALRVMKKNLRAAAGESMLHVLELAHRPVAGTVQEDGSEKRTSARRRGLACCTHGSQPAAPWRGTVREERSDAKVAGESMLHALEPARRAAAGNTAS